MSVPSEPEHIHRAVSSHGPRKHALFRFFQKRDYLVTRDAREILEEFVNGISPFEIIDQILDRNARTGKTRRAAHDLRIDFDHGAHFIRSISSRYFPVQSPIRVFICSFVTTRPCSISRSASRTAPRNAISSATSRYSISSGSLLIA